MNAPQAMPYAEWIARLRVLAEERGLAWMVGQGPHAHRDGYDRGLSAEEELQSLADISQWRGCGCGGG